MHIKHTKTYTLSVAGTAHQAVRPKTLFAKIKYINILIPSMKGLYMKTPFFASFIIFIIWLSYELSNARRRSAREQDSYWKREAAANNTRRKSLDGLNYIHIPFDSLPMDIMKEDDAVAEFHQTLRYLAESPIVNFTGYSNTDLKLKYGAPNINLLTRYDQNYTTLVHTLQKWADRLYESGYTAQTRQILEFAISTNTDVSGTYRILASIYSREGNREGIRHLLERAENLQSANRNVIVRILQEFDP